jgi:bacterioferritin
MSDFLSDIETLRRNAREHIEKGPITETYGADRDRVVAVLNEVLATELVCVLRYKRHYYMAQGLHSSPVAQEFLQHATE